MFNSRHYFYMQGAPDHPICPVWLGDAKLASTFADQMLGKLLLGFSCCSIFFYHLYCLSICVFDKLGPLNFFLDPLIRQQLEGCY